jgi:DMSO/TMAO reductase YedYZ molybdopterin-dependent catalytic subunit
MACVSHEAPMIALRLICALCMLFPAVAFSTTPVAAQVAATAVTLSIAGDVTTPITLTPTELKAMPRSTVKVEADGQTTTYEGVLVGELLKRAGAPVGAALRGDAISTYIVAIAKDGYQAVFSIAELDPAFTGSEILVADTADGKPLFEYQGPLRIVCPKDTKGARSVRMLERINVVRLKK